VMPYRSVAVDLKLRVTQRTLSLSCCGLVG
jgi:hypothetical protein